MNKKLLEFAQAANRKCLTPVQKIDPRFLTEFAHQVVNECMRQVKTDEQTEEEIRKRIFTIIFKEAE